MSRKRGRPPRSYRVRVRTVRREQIDYDALARAALEQAAMEQQEREGEPAARPQLQLRTKRQKGSRHDRLA